MTKFLKFSSLLLLSICCFSNLAVAQTGGEVFRLSACSMLENVLANDFGALLTVIAGSLAIIASVTGSFRGAWALIFVSVGSFIFSDIVHLLFPLGCAGGGG